MFQIKNLPDKNTPKFQQVIDAMITAIDSGYLAHGSKCFQVGNYGIGV